MARVIQLVAVCAAVFCLPAGAQPVPLSNYWQRFDRGLTLGTNAFTNAAGTLRWNPASLVPDFHDGTAWRPFGTGSSSVSNFGYGLKGSGTTNPLAVDETQVAVPTGRTDGAALVYDSASGLYSHAFVARAVSNDVDYAQLLATDFVVPKGQLVRITLGAGAGDVYAVENPIDLSVFATNDFTWLPAGVSASNYWRLFVEEGAAGAQGIRGDAGLNGTGNLFFGPWDDTFAYAYSTNPWTVVESAGQWYRLVATNGSTGEIPTENPGVWTVSVARGESGTITVVSNLVDRGAWSAGTQYAKLDSVTRYGNRFYVDPTNSVPAIDEAPPLDSNGVGYTTNSWTLDVARGARGLTGPSGAMTQYFAYSYYSLMDTNASIFDNLPAASSPAIRWVSESGGTNRFEFTGAAWMGTNKLTSSNGVVYFNGAELCADDFAALSDGYRPTSPAVLADGVATIHPASNSMFFLDASASAVTNVAVDLSGVGEGEAVVAGLEVLRGTNEWGWGGLQFLGTTNAPATNAATPYLIYRFGSTRNFAVY